MTSNRTIEASTVSTDRVPMGDKIAIALGEEFYPFSWDSWVYREAPPARMKIVIIIVAKMARNMPFDSVLGTIPA